MAAVLWQLAGITGLYGIEPASPLVLQDAVYATVGAIFFYYVLVAASEEAVKHFGFLSGSFPSSGTLQQALVSGTFVALGFSFVENILYLATIASSGSVFSGIYWQTLGYRSVFSTFLHVTCSAMLAVSFFGSFIASDRMTPWMAFRRYLIYGVGAAILVHAVFNSAMVLGFPGIVFAYLVGGYLYITSIFSSEQTERGYL
ncbi:MAG TPA: PrsW family glutamic-type intramembrane protease [bacterium]|nr:PrsW family glutamic-type intramembrane protease [bacterium]